MTYGISKSQSGELGVGSQQAVDGLHEVEADDTHFVLKGGLQRTAFALLRRTFRNWCREGYPDVFSTFRLVRVRPCNGILIEAAGAREFGWQPRQLPGEALQAKAPKPPRAVFFVRIPRSPDRHIRSACSVAGRSSLSREFNSRVGNRSAESEEHYVHLVSGLLHRLDVEAHATGCNRS